MNNRGYALSVEIDDDEAQVMARSGSMDRAAPTLWAVILAGGEGVRLQPLTQYVAGDLRPEQFARLLGARSLLRQTLDRTGLSIPRRPDHGAAAIDRGSEPQERPGEHRLGRIAPAGGRTRDPRAPSMRSG
jgi:hypothetical protein